MSPWSPPTESEAPPMPMVSSEVPGFHLPGSPRFNHADGAWMFGGDVDDPLAVLDLAMVFGSRLWGHGGELLTVPDLGAPGVGDLYTHELRERAVTALCNRVSAELGEPSDDWRALVLHTGSEAVETAIKTALRATSRTHLAAFEGGYHGTFGLALAVTHGAGFRGPWTAQYGHTVRWHPWGQPPTLDEGVGCVVVEPWLGRAGVWPPPPGFHAAVRAECDRVGAVLVLDAVLCGAGRTGDTIAECIVEAQPDIVCLGKALGGGVTSSAVVMRTVLAERAWDHGAVEPAHTSTSLGEPVASLGVLRSLRSLDQHGAALAEMGDRWGRALGALHGYQGLEVRGTGLLWAIDTGRPGGGVRMAQDLLEQTRVLVVPSGSQGSSITLYPAAVMSPEERDRVVEALATVARQ